MGRGSSMTARTISMKPPSAKKPAVTETPTGAMREL
jgi:hypothetical protein